MNTYPDYGMSQNVVPLIGPVDTAATAVATPWVDLKTAVGVTFDLFFGAITTGTADSNITVTVEAATAAATGSEAAMAFKYRLSGAVGANTLGALTAATASGVSVASTDDNKVLEIYLDTAALPAALEDSRFVRVVVTPTADHTATLVSAVARLDVRYQRATMISAT